jgi:hypothetical protein
MGKDGPQAAIEAIAGGAHGFCVVLSLPFIFIYFGRAHELVTGYDFCSIT